MDCLFCKIIGGIIPAEKVFEDEVALAFADIGPQAPVHLLIVPKEHVSSLDGVVDGKAVGTGDWEALLGHLLLVGAKLGKMRLPGGYRIVINTGADGGQTVGHLHLHLLGGRAMHWPPG